jgi:hypothetical protein
MSAHKLPGELKNAPFERNDPGTGNAIVVDAWNVNFPLTIGTTAETNTLAAPLKSGDRVTIMAVSVGSGGSRVVTVASAYDAAGSTTLTFDAVDERVVLESVEVGTAGSPSFEWRVVSFEGVTGPVVNASSVGVVSVTDAATYAVLAADSGKPHILPNFTSTCTITLPTAAAGLRYEFISKAVAADAQDWKISTGSATNFWLGGVSFADTDAGAAADEIHAGIFPNGSTNDFLNVVTPGAGTRIIAVCDGTNWIACGAVYSATVPAFADT